MNLKDKPEVDFFICQKIQYVVEYAKVWIRPYDIYISQTKCHVSSDYKFQKM